VRVGEGVSVSPDVRTSGLSINLRLGSLPGQGIHPKRCVVVQPDAWSESQVGGGADAALEGRIWRVWSEGEVRLYTYAREGGRPNRRCHRRF
jgi:hypothetical protein